MTNIALITALQITFIYMGYCLHSGDAVGYSLTAATGICLVFVTLSKMRK